MQDAVAAAADDSAQQVAGGRAAGLVEGGEQPVDADVVAAAYHIGGALLLVESSRCEV